MTAKKIIGTTVVAVTCATTAGSYAYTQNNVTDIPAAFAIGAVGACTTPIGQRLARNVLGQGRSGGGAGGALLACAPTAFMKKKKDGDHLTETTVDGDHAPGGTAEVRPGGAAALALAGKADELVARGGILEYLMTGKQKDLNQEPTRRPSGSLQRRKRSDERFFSAKTGVVSIARRVERVGLPDRALGARRQNLFDLFAIFRCGCLIIREGPVGKRVDQLF
jgi:hypothetical protein